MSKNVISIFKASIVTTALVLVSVLILNTNVNAADTKMGLTVSPIRFETNINPGETKANKIKIANYSEGRIHVNLSAELFSVINPQYDYEFNAKSKIADWIKFSDNSIDLNIGETKTISYSINVPNVAEPGGYYLSIFSSSDASSDDSAIKSKQRVASLLYLTVLGDITKTGKLVSLSTPWLVDDKSMWSMSIQNTGNAHFRSDIKVKLVDFFGTTINSNSGGSPLILPETVRGLSGLLPTPQIPGFYKVNFEVGLGDSRQRNDTRYIFYAPLWFVSSALVFLIAIAGFIVYRMKNRN